MSEALLHSRSRPVPVLPLLRAFGWDMKGRDPEVVYRDGFHLLFMHPGLRSLGLYNIPDAWVNWHMYDLGRFMLDVAQMSPGITTLDIRPCSAQQGDAVLELASRLTHLEYVGLTQMFLTTNFVEVLSRLPNLIQMASRLDSHEDVLPWDYEAPLELRDFPFYSLPSLEAGAFHSLQAIQLCLTLKDANVLLHDEHFPSAQLQHVCLRTVKPATNADVRAFLSTFVSRCPNATSFVFIIYPPGHEGNEDADLFLEELDIGAIEPLRQASRLEQLVIDHITPINLSERDLFHLIEHLQQLQILYLAPSPDWRSSGQPSPSQFGWHTLSAIIRSLPLLVDLGLYCNLSLTPNRLDPPPHGLYSLALGTTPVPTMMSVHALAYRLSLLLDGSGELNAGLSSLSRYGVPGPSYSDEAGLEEKLAPWAEIEKLVYLSLSARSGVFRSVELDEHE